MAFVHSKPGPFHRGDRPPGATDLNMIVQAVMRQIRGGTNTDVSNFGDRVTVGSSQIEPQLASASNYVMQFTVLQELADSLLCAVFTQPASPFGWIPQPYFQGLQLSDQIQYQVAKPYYLQQTPWNGMLVGVSGGAVFIQYTAFGARTIYSIDGPQIILLSSEALGGVLPDKSTPLYVVFALNPASGAQVSASNISAIFIQAPNQTVELQWTAIPGTLRYDVYRSFGGNLLSNFIYIGTAFTNAFTDPGGQTGPQLIYSWINQTKQEIIPAYLPGDVILATRTWTGYFDANQNSILWMDTNAAGRTWNEVIDRSVPKPCGTPGPPPLLYASVNKALIGSFGLEPIPIYADQEEDGLITWTGGELIYDDSVPGTGPLIGSIWLRFWPIQNTYVLDIWANGTLSQWEPDSGFTCNPLFWGRSSIASVTESIPASLATDPTFALVTAIVAEQVAAATTALQAYIDAQIPGAVAAYLASIGGVTGGQDYLHPLGGTGNVTTVSGIVTSLT